MRQHARIRTIVAAVVVTVCSLGIVPVGGAGATDHCIRSGCNGLAPSKGGCLADATRVVRVRRVGMIGALSAGRITVAHMYSPRCRASWSRLTVEAARGLTISGTSWIDGHRPVTEVTSSTATVVSRMWAGQTQDACGRGVYNNGLLTISVCTAPA